MRPKIISSILFFIPIVYYHYVIKDHQAYLTQHEQVVAVLQYLKTCDIDTYRMLSAVDCCADNYEIEMFSKKFNISSNDCKMFLRYMIVHNSKSPSDVPMTQFSEKGVGYREPIY